MFGPVPSKDVVAAGYHKQAASRRVGVVDEDLFVDALRGTVVGDVDEPKRFESAIKCPTTHPLLLSEFRQRRCGDDIGHEVFKVAGLRAIGAGSCHGTTAVRVFAPPPSCALDVVPFSSFAQNIPGIVVCFYLPGKHTTPRLAHAGASPMD